jgi:hypothetical protein
VNLTNIISWLETLGFKKKKGQLATIFLILLHSIKTFKFKIDTDIYIAQHTSYQGFSVTGYIRTATGVKQTEVDKSVSCRLTYRNNPVWVNIRG